MSDRHQHQTPERDAAEARVREANRAFGKQWSDLTDVADDFLGNAGNPGELESFRKSMRALDTAAEELHAAKSVGGG